MDENEDKLYKREKARMEALRGFYIHALVYVVVNLGLFALNMLTSRDSLWFYWPLLGWGIGLAINGIVVFAGGLFSADWEERKIRELMDEERHKQLHRPAWYPTTSRSVIDAGGACPALRASIAACPYRRGRLTAALVRGPGAIH